MIHFTTTEGKIIQLIAIKAASNLEISELIGCSERTIETHIRNIFAKTGYKKREEIILNYRKEESK